MKSLAQLLVVLWWMALGAAQAASYGLDQRPAVGPFLNDQLPSLGPVISGNWSAVVAFPSLRFTNALGLTSVPGTTRLAVWEREGRVWSFENQSAATTKQLVLDIRNRCQGWDDSGLLGLAYHPGFVTNRWMFVYYTWVTPGTVTGSPTVRPATFKTGAYHDRLSRFTLDDAGVALPNSELVLVDQVADSVWHNGGGLFFHPVNGFLYWTNGDDEHGPSQIINQDLLAGVFRIDVDQRGGNISHPIRKQPARGQTANYFIPNDNPFVDQAGVLEEFYALGLRSPHRMTLDPPTGRIFIGDVGAGAREEIDVIEPGDPVGLNFQWSRIEGLNGDLTPPYIGANKRPILDYGRDDGQAIIGGYVYRGAEFAADLGGRYIFGDNVQGRIWALDESTVPPTKKLLCVLPKGPGANSGADYTGLSSFGVDANQELYLCQLGNLGGQIFKLKRTGTPPAVRDFPPLLSQTGAFTETASLTPAAALIPYGVNSPLWSDASVKHRWMAIPTNTTIGFSPTGEWTFPAGSVWVKHFELTVDETNPLAPKRRLETRLLVRDTAGTVFGATYKWRPDQQDAELLPAKLDEDLVIQTATGTRTQTWHYPSRSECLQCHSVAAGGVLGVKTRQNHGDLTYPNGVTDNQLRTWNHVGLFNPALNEANLANFVKLVGVTHPTADLETRARSYLDANCSHCHRPGGVRAFWDARFETPLASAGILNGSVAQALGIPGARVVVPGHPERSLLLHRANSVNPLVQMPPLARNVIDTAAVGVMTDWITSLPPIPDAVPAPWAHADIGAVNTPGDAVYTSGVLSVNASGDDIWNFADAFHYVYQSLTGDGELIARVNRLDNTDGWAKAGVMVRESLAPGSRHAFALVSRSNGTAFQRRPNTNGGSEHTSGPAATVPYWVRLKRTGNQITSYASPDGSTWTQIGTLTMALPGQAFIGLAVTAHNNQALNLAAFDQVRAVGAVAPLNAAPLAALTSPAPGAQVLSPGLLTLAATATDGDGTVSRVEFFAGTAKVGEATTAPYRAVWSNPGLGTHTLTARAIDNLGASATSAPVAVSVQALTLAAPTRDPAGNTLTLTFPGQAGSRYLVEASTDLLAWTPVATQLVVDGQVQFSLSLTDPGFSTRFYRARLAP